MTDNLPKLPEGWKKVGDARSPGIRYYGILEREFVTGFSGDEVYIYLRDGLGNETGLYFPLTVVKHIHAMLGETIKKAQGE